VIDVVEVLVHWHAGRRIGELSSSLGVDPKTVRKYVAPAIAAGLAPGGPPVSGPEWSKLVEGWFPELVDRAARQLSWPEIEGHREAIRAWLGQVTVSTIHQRLRDDHGLSVSESSLRRFIWANFAEEAARASVVVLRDAPQPGDEHLCGFPHRISSPGAVSIGTLTAGAALNLGPRRSRRWRTTEGYEPVYPSVVMISYRLDANSFSAGGAINCPIRSAHTSSITLAAGAIVLAGGGSVSQPFRDRRRVIPQLLGDLTDRVSLTAQSQQVHVLLLGHHAGWLLQSLRCLVARKAGGAVNPAGGLSSREASDSPRQPRLSLIPEREIR